MLELLIGILTLLFLIVAVVTLGTVFFVGAIQFVTGITRLRFSLRSLMIAIFCGGLCATLLAQRDYVFLFVPGILFTLGYAITIVIYLLDLGAAPSSESDKDSPQTVNGLTIVNLERE